MGLNLAKAIEASSVVLHNDSQVVIRHINEEYEAKGERMTKYLDLVWRRMDQNFEVKLLQVSRRENEHVDRLAKAASAKHSATN